MTGQFIAVVGPSGVGKDSVMAGLVAADPHYVLARRTITRPQDAGGETFTEASREAFAQAVAHGQFALHWESHGLCYGIPVSVHDDLAAGRHVLANLSRAVLDKALRAFPNCKVVNLTASAQVLALRLSGRGRESADDIARRLAQAGRAIPEGIEYITVANEGPLHITVAKVHKALQPVSAAQ